MNSKINLRLLIGVSILISIIPILIAPSGTFPTKNVMPEEIGWIIGYVFWHALILIIIPLVINTGINYFTLNSEKRWWLIWLVFLIISMGSFKYHLNDYVIYINKRLYTEGCIKEIRKRAVESNLPENSIVLLELEKYCPKATDAYFDCLDKGGEKKACMIKIAELTTLSLKQVIKKGFSENCINKVKETAVKSNKLLDDDLLSGIKRVCDIEFDFFFNCLIHGGTEKACLVKMNETEESRAKQFFKEEWFKNCIDEMKEYASKRNVSIDNIVISKHCAKRANTFHDCLKKDNSVEVCIGKTREAFVAN